MGPDELLGFILSHSVSSGTNSERDTGKFPLSVVAHWLHFGCNSANASRRTIKCCFHHHKGHRKPTTANVKGVGGNEWFIPVVIHIIWKCWIERYSQDTQQLQNSIVEVLEGNLRELIHSFPASVTRALNRLWKVKSLRRQIELQKYKVQKPKDYLSSIPLPCKAPV